MILQRMQAMDLIKYTLWTLCGLAATVRGVPVQQQTTSSYPTPFTTDSLLKSETASSDVTLIRRSAPITDTSSAETSINLDKSTEETTLVPSEHAQTDVDDRKSRIIRSLTTEPTSQRLNRAFLDGAYMSSEQLATRIDFDYNNLMKELSLSSAPQFRVDIAYATRPRLPAGVTDDAMACKNTQTVLDAVQALVRGYVPYAEDLRNPDVTSLLYSVARNIEQLSSSTSVLSDNMPGAGHRDTIQAIYTLIALKYQNEMIKEILLSLKQC